MGTIKKFMTEVSNLTLRINVLKMNRKGEVLFKQYILVSHRCKLLNL